MEIEDKVADALIEMAKDIRRMKNEDLQETLEFISKIKSDEEIERFLNEH